MGIGSRFTFRPCIGLDHGAVIGIAESGDLGRFE
jgi:hypothetical protein